MTSSPRFDGLARRAVACAGWRWLPGMVDEYGDRATIVEPDGSILPDLTDPATLGCLLALVREAWGDDGLACVTAAYTHASGYEFRVLGGHHHGSTFQWMSERRHATEAEALVAALEAAPT